MFSRRCAAFTWTETLIALCLLIFLLFFVSMPPLHTSGRYSQFTETLSQMRKLHLTTQMMALDGTTTGNTNLAWPGSQDGTFSTWAKALVPAYLSTNEFCKLLSASNFPVDPRSLPTENRNAVLVYAVTEEQGGSVVFLTTANFTNTPTGGDPLLPNSRPYGTNGFAVFRKGGDGSILLPEQVTSTNLIGTYAPPLQ